MKKNYKKLIFSVLAVIIFLPLASMANSDNISLSEKNKKSIQHRQSSMENFNHSSINKEDRLLQRESRRLENRAKHAEMMDILETGDYNAWLEFVKDKNCPITFQVNEENFAEFVEAHKQRVEKRNSENRELNKGNFRNKIKSVNLSI